MSNAIDTARKDLFAPVSFGGGGESAGGSGGGMTIGGAPASQVAMWGALCGVSTHVAMSMPSVTPQTAAAKAVATGVSIVSCSIAVAPVTNAHWGW